MAIVMSNDVSVVISGTNLSDHCREVKLDMSAEDLDATGMGALSKTHARGLRDDRVELTMMQDYAAGSVDATFSGLFSSTGFSVVIKPTSASVSSTNPSYTMTAILLDYSPIDASVGEISMPEVVLVPAPGSSIVRAVS